MTIYLGSTRPAKVDGARDALAAIARLDHRFAAQRLQPHDLTAVAPTMPMSVAAIVGGARQRAEALAALPGFAVGADFAVGLEGGLEAVEFDGGRCWTLQSWAAVTDGARWSLGAGPSLQLPAAVAARVVAGEELGDVIDRLAGAPVRGTRGAWGVLTRDLIGRREAFRLATLAAFAPFYGHAARP